MVNIIGMGYIGLPTALMLAANGIKITGTDVNRNLVNTLNEGELSFKEEGLYDLFKSAKQNICFTTEYISADIYIIAVPTPYEHSDKKINPDYIIEAVKRVMMAANKGSIIVIESTVSPGTVDKFIRPIILDLGLETGKDIHLAHAPERIIPGNMVCELESNSRVIGADDVEVGKKIRNIYKSFCRAEIIITDIRTAEMTKVVENTYRDINIAFANELAKICRIDNMDVYEIIKIANMHPRVNILQPGPGVGGHCISVDPWFLVGDYPGLANIILAARKINDSMPEFVIERILDIMQQHDIKDLSRVGLYGLTYKEDVDDMRESPSLQLLDNLKRHLATGIKVYDPYIKHTITSNQFFELEEFLDAVDMVVMMVGHSEIKQSMHLIKKKVVLDTRNICDFSGAYKL